MTCEEAQDQLEDEVDVYLDGGQVGGDGLTSTVVDATTERLRVVRLGGLGLEELRRVVPDLLGPGESQAHDGGVAEPVDRGEDAGREEGTSG